MPRVALEKSRYNPVLGRVGTARQNVRAHPDAVRALGGARFSGRGVVQSGPQRVHHRYFALSSRSSVHDRAAPHFAQSFTSASSSWAEYWQTPQYHLVSPSAEELASKVLLHESGRFERPTSEETALFHQYFGPDDEWCPEVREQSNLDRGSSNYSEASQASPPAS